MRGRNGGEDVDLVTEELDSTSAQYLWFSSLRAVCLRDVQEGGQMVVKTLISFCDELDILRRLPTPKCGEMPRSFKPYHINIATYRVVYAKLRSR